MKARRKIVTLVTIISSIITVFYSGFYFILPFYFTHCLKQDISAASIGIIGGADGPTSVFIASAPKSNFILFIFFSLSIIGIIFLVKTRKEKRDN